MSKNIVAIIPARYHSTRLPGKPLAIIGDKTMIERVYAQCKKAMLLNQVIVATDDARILGHCKSKNIEVVLTNTNHINGTTRCLEVAQKIGLNDKDIVINVQGDEPFIDPKNIDGLAQLLLSEKSDIASLCKRILNDTEIENSNIVKVVKSIHNRAIYFSRFNIPFVRETIEKNDTHFFKHIGLYAYTYKALSTIALLPESNLEKAEKLEQLRWLENDFSILLHEVFEDTIAIDTPQDLLLANEYLNTIK